MRLPLQPLLPLLGRTTPKSRHGNDGALACSFISPYATESSGRRRAFIAFGSNVGDRVAMIEEGLRAMERREMKLLRTSSLWETDPMYVADQGRFLNGVCEVSSWWFLRAEWRMLTWHELGRD